MKPKNILLITSSIDKTADYIITYYPECSFFRFNTDHLSDYRVSISNNSWQLSHGAFNLTSEETHSIYYRKPVFPALIGYDASSVHLIQRDIISLINGIADSFDGLVLTRPSILRKAENKVFQLLTAASCGMTVPESYIGTDNSFFTPFSHNRSIIKPISTAKIKTSHGYDLFQTEYFEIAPDDISVTPVYLQNYIEKQFEARVTIVGNNIFPVRIDCKNKLDWRQDYASHRYQTISLPPSIEESCKEMMKRYNLIFGAFDFIITPDEKWIFLEVNPNGQWLWLEQALSLPISNKIIELLTS